MNRPRRLNLPDPPTCLAILARHNTPDHVIRHSQAVCVVALHLTHKLFSQGYPLNEALVRAAALLHDVTKAYSFKVRLDHALTGAKLLKKLGYPEVGQIVGQHVRLSRSRPKGRISEVEIVNYADKRVVDDRITTLRERLHYIRSRYGRSPEALARIDKFSSLSFQLEEEIFAVLPDGPEQLLQVDVEKGIMALCPAAD